MKLFIKQLSTVSLLFSIALSNLAFAQDEGIPRVVQIEGMSEMLSLLKQIDQGISKLAESRWEYRLVQRNLLNDNLTAQISALGRDGWELVSANVSEGFIFKRRMPY